MSERIICKKCRIEMEMGYIPDGSHRGYVKQIWFKGAQMEEEYKGVKSGTVQIPDKKEGKDITTYRCPQCGLLEFYAF